MVPSEPIWIRNILKYLTRTGFTLIDSQCMVWLLLMAKSNPFVQKEELTEQNALNAKLVNSAFQLLSKVKVALKNRVHHILSRNPNSESVLFVYSLLKKHYPPSQSAPTILVFKRWVGLWPWKKSGPTYGPEKSRVQKIGSLLKKREKPRLPLLFLNNNDPDFLHLAFCTHKLDLF